MSSEHPLPSNPLNGRSPSPVKDERAGFSRSGFAPIPHRHQDMPPVDEFERREPPRREPVDRWEPREEFERRPAWDDYDRKRRRSPSPPHPSHRPRMRSPSPPRSHGYPDPAEVETLLSFKQFADWFRASHPQTARADEEEVRRAIEGEGLGKEKKGMGKRYERYRKEYTSRQLYALYLTHRESPWFLERYSQDPEYVAQRRRINRQGRVATSEKYLEALRSGEYDTVSFDLDPVDQAGDDPLRVEVPPAERQVFVKTVPPSTSRKDLEDLFGQVEGFQYLAVTEPFAKKAFHRVAWAQFAEGVDPEEVVKKLDGSKIDNFVFHMGVNASPVIGRIRITAAVASTLERLLLDGEKAHDLAYKLEEELVEEDGTGLKEKGTTEVQSRIDQLLREQKLVGDDLADDLKLNRAKLIADHWISYLRHGLSTCYYCVAPNAFQEELHRKCISHKRPDATTDAAADDDHEDEEEDRTERPERRPRVPNDRWEEGLDHKLRPLLQPVDVQEYGGRDPEEETNKLAAPLIKQEEASKYRCKECQKLFRAPEFVIKHITVKHPDMVEVKTEEIAMLNAFVLDPQRLQPTAQTPAAVNDRLLPPPQPHFAPNGNMNMMQQQMMMMMQMQQAMMMNMGSQGQGLAQRMGGFAEAPIAPLPAVPPGSEDPRAKRGRLSYQDLDEPGTGGDGGLPY